MNRDRAHPASEQPLVEPKAQLEILTAQVQGLRQQLDAFITRRNEAVAERASRHVEAIVAAAERSAADIRAAAEQDAATMRESLLAEAEAEAQRIRADAQTDAARIRAEAHAVGVRMGEKALADASGEIESARRRLTDQLGTDGGTAIAVPSSPMTQIADEVQLAVDELEGAAGVVGESVRDVGANREQRGRVNPGSSGSDQPLLGGVDDVAGER